MGARLHKKSALITGAAGSLGQSAARAFAREGAEHLVLADLDPSALDSLAADDWPDQVQVVTKRLDVTDGDAYDELVADIAAERGSLDIVVNTAGIVSPNARIHNLSTDEFQRALTVNLTGTFHTIRAVARAMRKKTPVSIVNVASISGVTAWAYAAPYCASKAGVIHLTRVAALEYAKEGIRVNSVSPGTFPSALHHDLPQQALDAIEAKHPLGFGSADDITNAIIYLASDESRWVTGHSLIVDGGYSLP